MPRPHLFTLLLLAGCQATPAPLPPNAAIPGYARELLALAGRPDGLLPALQLALLAPDASLAPLAARQALSASPDLQVAALCLQLQLASGSALDRLVFDCLDHPVYVVRRAACVRLAAMAQPANALVERLRTLVRQESSPPVLTEACAALARVQGPAQADFVYDSLVGRGAEVLDCALPTLCASPDPKWRDYLRSQRRSADRDAVILANRALLRLGEPVEAEGNRLAQLQTDEEFGRATERAEQDLHLTPRAYEDLLADLRHTQVLVIGELHDSAPIAAAEILLAADWQSLLGDRVLDVVYEEPAKASQTLLLGWAESRDLTTRSLEKGGALRSAQERSGEARQQLLQLARQHPDHAFLVVYGDVHRPNFVDFLNQNGIAATGLSLAVGGQMLTRAIHGKNSLNIRGTAFFDGHHTWCLPVLSWASFGLPADQRL